MSKLIHDISVKVNYRFLSGSSSLSKILKFEWLISVFQNSGKCVCQNSKKVIGQYLEGWGVFRRRSNFGHIGHSPKNDTTIKIENLFKCNLDTFRILSVEYTNINMGSFGGHVLAGSFFIFFAIWWTVQMFHRHLISLRRKIPFRSTVTYPCTCLCGKLQEWPIEGFLKFAFTFLGGLLEVITGTSNGKFVVLVNGQHATSYFFYALSGLFDLLMYYRVSWIPDDLDWIISLVAVGVEGLLLYFHLHGRSILDVHIHMLLVYTIVLNILAICFEIRFRHSLLAALGRAYFFFLQGTWLWQIAFIIYDPDPNAEKWKGDDHDELMIATMFFAWHVGAVLFVMLAIGAAVSCFHQRQKGIRNEEAESKHLKKLHYDGQFLNSDDDTESDIEFQTLITK